MLLDEVEGEVDPEKDSGRYMAVLVEALSILGRVQDALDVGRHTLTHAPVLKCLCSSAGHPATYGGRVPSHYRESFHSSHQIM